MSWSAASEMKCWNNKLRSLFGVKAALPTENGVVSFGLHNLVFSRTKPRRHWITGKIPLFYSPSGESFCKRDFDRVHDYILDAFKRAGIGDPSINVKGDDLQIDLDIFFSSPDIFPKPPMEDRAQNVLAELDTLSLYARADVVRRQAADMMRAFAVGE